MPARLAALDDITDDGRYTSRVLKLATEPAREPGREPANQKQNLVLREVRGVHACSIMALAKME